MVLQEPVHPSAAAPESKPTPHVLTLSSPLVPFAPLLIRCISQNEETKYDDPKKWGCKVDTFEVITTFFQVH